MSELKYRSADEIVNSIVGTFTVDGMTLADDNIDELHRLVNGEITVNDSIANLNAKYNRYKDNSSLTA
jgi:hypothetical protein